VQHLLDHRGELADFDERHWGENPPAAGNLSYRIIDRTASAWKPGDSAFNVH
jgi:hypothetical protein